jgi:hypothetical protein
LKYFIHQTNKTNCGITTAKMLLAIVHQDSRFLLLIYNDYSSMMSFAQFVKVSADYGVKLQGIKLNDIAQLKIMKTPFIGLIKQNENNHYVLIKKCWYNNKKRCIYDGAKGIYTLDINNLQTILTPYYLIIQQVNPYRLTKQEYFNLSTKYRFVHLSIHLISLLMLLASFYFVNERYPFYIGLSLLVLTALLQIGQRFWLIKAMKEYDREIIKYSTKHDGPFYRSIIDLKGKYFKYPLLIINQLIFVIFIVGIHVANDIYYLILIGIITFILVIYRYGVIKFIDKKTTRVEQLEQKILKEDQSSFLINYHKINKLTYDIVNYDLLIKTIIIFLIATMTFLLMAIRGHVFINYFLFTAISLIIYADNFDKLLQTQRRNLDIKDAINHIISR